MKRAGILNRHLAGALAGLGHGDGVLVCDAGMPVPAGPLLVDLAFRAGVPSFAEVLEGLLDELVIATHSDSGANWPHGVFTGWSKTTRPGSGLSWPTAGDRCRRPRSTSSGRSGSWLG